MTIGSNGTPSEKNARVVVARSPAQQEGKLKLIGGSASDDWNNVLANQTLQTLWAKNSDEHAITQQLAATSAALVGISPRDELEGMMARQLIAAHHLTQSGSVKALPNPERKRDQLRSVDARVWENRSTT